MIYSMTGFARRQNESEAGTIVCELRSVNHRYLEISLRVPEVLRVLDTPIRDCIKQSIHRGKLDCDIRYQPNTKTGSLFAVNTFLVAELAKASKTVAKELGPHTPVALGEILRFPGVLEAKEADSEWLQQQVCDLLKDVLADLILARQREGEGLKHLFLQRLNVMEAEIHKVRAQFPQIIQEQHLRLSKKFQDINLVLDPMRLEQEMVLYAQKIDVSEEIERALSHLAEIRRILQEGGLVGRRLDFLLQELNREANTLAAKSVDSLVTHAAVEMKVLIEQIREQVQNVE